MDYVHGKRPDIIGTLPAATKASPHAKVRTACLPDFLSAFCCSEVASLVACTSWPDRVIPLLLASLLARPLAAAYCRLLLRGAACCYYPLLFASSCRDWPLFGSACCFILRLGAAICCCLVMVNAA